jgi:hypothetical protein
MDEPFDPDQTDEALISLPTFPTIPPDDSHVVMKLKLGAYQDAWFCVTRYVHTHLFPIVCPSTMYVN